MQDINDMLVFATVVEAGSFTAAAESMGLPKSNISRKVTRLEEKLGVRLLERSTRTQHLTEIGGQYYAYCRRIQEEVSASQLAVETMLERPQGTLKVCASVAIGQSMLAGLIPTFHQRFPDIDIELDLTNRRVDVLEEGYDVVIRVGELSLSNLVAKKLSRLCLSLYCSPGYQEKRGLPTEPNDLTNHECLLMSAKERKPIWTLKNQTESVQIAIKPVLKCDDFSVLKQLTVDGMGISELPQYMVKELVGRGELVKVLPEWEFEPVNLYAIYPSHRGATPKLRAFLDYLYEGLTHLKQ
ncbi:LysR family transcriptional regulator [Vibrio lamellibrachiae]|uniref:LysR family transcriptional regulator n=1 Tax=Vibrio lamellibrachiae TaxID=2910253 RepID=UPI003D1012E7